MAQPGFSFLVCGDSALLKEEFGRQIASWTDAKQLVFWGDEEPGDNFWGSLQQVGLFAERRIVLVRRGEFWPAAIWKNISTMLSRPQEGIWPFFCLEVAFEKGKHKIPAHIQKCAAFTFAEKQKWVWRDPGIGKNKAAYIKSQAQKYGISLPADLLNSFCAAVPDDASSISNELAKLSLIATGGKITRDLLPPTSESLESDAFGLIRRLYSGDLPGVWQEISRDSDGSLLFFVIALLAREFRNLWQLAAGQSPRMYPAEKQRLQTVAKKLGFPGISAGFAAILDAEWHVKSGKMTPQQALEHLCVTIANIFCGNRTYALP